MNAKFKILLQGWLLHFGGLTAVLLFFSFLHRHDQTEPIWHYFARHIINMDSLLAALVTLLAEIYYQYLFRKLKLVLLILACLLCGTFAVCVIIGLKTLPFRLDNLRVFDPLLIIAAYIFGYALVRNYFYTLSLKKEIQLQQSKHELDTLKAQLNPHFLFNSLNYLYGTALNEKAQHTADGIDQLSEMMRYTITGIHQNFVPLANELKFMAHYLSLQQARLPERESIKIAIQLPTEIPALQIAPLLLLPFVENAFKYGISMDEACFVTIKIDVTDMRLIMYVHNSITSKPIEVTGNNTGIKNTIKRLNLLYPNNYQLEQTGTPTEYKTNLNIQLKS